MYKAIHSKVAKTYKYQHQYEHLSLEKKTSFLVFDKIGLKTKIGRLNKI